MTEFAICCRHRKQVAATASKDQQVFTRRQAVAWLAGYATFVAALYVELLAFKLPKIAQPAAAELCTTR